MSMCNNNHKNSKRWLIALLAMFAITFPILLNRLIHMPALGVFPFRKGVAGDESNWLMFWPTYLSAIASFAVVLFTAKSIKENRRQNDENNERRMREIQYQQDNERLSEIINISEDCASLLNAEYIKTIISECGSKPYDEACEKLKVLSYQSETKDLRLRLLLTGNENLESAYSLIHDNLKEFRTIINDFIVVICDYFGEMDIDRIFTQTSFEGKISKKMIEIMDGEDKILIPYDNLSNDTNLKLPDEFAVYNLKYKLNTRADMVKDLHNNVFNALLDLACKEQERIRNSFPPS